MPQVLYIVQGRLLGEGTLTYPGPLRSYSLAYFCPTCGEVWGRVVVEHSPCWSLETAPCEKHQPAGMPDWRKVPGSFLTGVGGNSRSDISIMFWGRAIEHLPPEVLKREFELTLKWYEGKHQDE